MNKEQELRPCPWCNGAAQPPMYSAARWFCRCTKCGTNGPSFWQGGPNATDAEVDAAKSQAIAAWNHRSSSVTPEQIAKEVAFVASGGAKRVEGHYSNALPRPSETPSTEWVRDLAMDVMLATTVDEAERIILHKMRRSSSDEQAEVVGALERGEVLPKLANCGHYLAEDNTGQWHYINHANTWQTYPGPTTAEARAIACAAPVAMGGVTEDQVEQAFRDGLAYATNCVVTDADEAWRTSRARAALPPRKGDGQ